MALQDLVFAFTAGVFTTLSPCSFPLLPGYFTYLLGSKTSLKRALMGGLAPTTGLVAALSTLGAIAGALGAVLLDYLPFIEFVVAAAIIALGVVMLLGIPIPSFAFPAKFVNRQGSFGLFTFGIGYGLASSACAAPIFFSVLLYSLVGGVVQGTITLLSYALGIGMVLTAVSFLVSEANEYLFKRMKKITFWLHRIGGLGLIAAGAYLLYILLLSVGIIRL